MAELIQCPFCGRIPTVEDCGTNRWFVRCQCGIAQDKLYHQRCDAVREWNRRKPITDVPSAVVGTQMSLADYISRQAAKNKKVYSEERHEYVIPVAEIDWLPSAQPEQIARDIATIIENEQDMRVVLKNAERTETHEWIPVTERLPEENDYKSCIECLDGAVWYFTENGTIGLGYYYKSTKEWSTTDDLKTDGKVVAWMPLPEAYKERREE